MRFSPDAMFVAEGNVGLKSICVDLRDRGYPVSKALEAAGAMLRKVILSGRLSVRILTANSEKVTPQVPLSFFWPAPCLDLLDQTLHGDGRTAHIDLLFLQWRLSSNDVR